MPQCLKKIKEIKKKNIINKQVKSALVNVKKKKNSAITKNICLLGNGEYPAPECPSNADKYWGVSPIFSFATEAKRATKSCASPLITVVQARDLGSVNQVPPSGTLNPEKDAKTKGQLRIYFQ